MSHTDSIRRKPAASAAAVLVLLLACLGLAACGGSSSSSSTGATTATSARTGTGTGAKGPLAGRFAAIRECLQKNGITLPKRTPGQNGLPAEPEVSRWRRCRWGGRSSITKGHDARAV